MSRCATRQPGGSFRRLLDRAFGPPGYAGSRKQRTNPGLRKAMMDFELTDRDRLAMAFDDLRTRGYIADVSMGYRSCCRDCALQAIAVIGDEHDEDGDLTLPDKFVFWHIQKDDWSFLDSGEGYPVPLEYTGKDEAWFEANTEEIEAAMVVDRLSKYSWLVNPLNLHWMGNADEIVGVLRRQGLSADVPNNDHWCIEVQPTKKVVRETV